MPLSKQTIELMRQLRELADEKSPVILYGPPGTGKTRLSGLLKEELSQAGKLGIVETVQFHRKFTYEDFIEGFQPSEAGFIRKDGVFKKFCEAIGGSDTKIDLFLIDEINRTDITTTFGEVLYSLEDRETRTVTTAHFGSQFSIPPSVFLLGTMNTADKSIAHVDFAVRRRFQFIPVFPDSEALQLWLGTFPSSMSVINIEHYVTFFRRTNARIRRSPTLGSHMQLGEAMFVPSSRGSLSELSLLRNFVNVVLPQVESYVGFGNLEAMGLIFNPIVAENFFDSRTVSIEDFIGLILESQTDESTGTR